MMPKGFIVCLSKMDLLYLAKRMKNAIKKFWDSEDGMGVVEVVLITIVLVGLVVVFKKQITSLVNSILSKMTNQANKI